MIDLKAKPFHLDDEAAAWVHATRDAMTEKEKTAQLFCLCARQPTEESALEMLSVLPFGGIMYRPFTVKEAVSFTAALKKHMKIPPLIAANLEKGGNGIVAEGTLLGSPMAVAATGDAESGARLGRLCGREGRAVGANWAFAPIIDIDYNYFNPITNTRTFGSRPELVAALGKAYVQAVQAEGVAASIKHFPGDGVDDRDQHLLSSVNSLSCEEWDKSYGEVWRTCIEAGAMTAMVGHIMQPAWTKKLNPEIADGDILPASLSPEIMQGLLRGNLGFNGLIVTDATTMAGITIPMKRRDAVPQTIAAGADMFLFARNLEEDFEFMYAGVRDGRITKERLNDAVTRILAVKAALQLHKEWKLPAMEEARQTVGCREHRHWARENADRAVTLVKEQPGVLPISVQKYPRILYYPIESQQGVAYGAKQGVCDHFREMLEKEGFQVTTFQPEPMFEGKVKRESDYTDHFDLALYVVNLVTKSNQTAVRIEWQQPMGANCPHYMAGIPTVAVSVENPYHLVDLPRVKTFVNAYCSNDETLEAVLDKLLGRSPFKGQSPVDPFCGRWDTRL